MDMSADARLTAGTLLVSIVAIELGGAYMLRVVRGTAAVTPFQLAFARAGHVMSPTTETVVTRGTAAFATVVRG